MEVPFWSSCHRRCHDRGFFAVDQPLEQVFLVLEIDVERALRDAGLGGDLVHAGRLEAEAHEAALGAIQNLRALDWILPRHPATLGRIGLFVPRILHGCSPFLFEPYGSISLDMVHREVYVNRTDQFSYLSREGSMAQSENAKNADAKNVRPFPNAKAHAADTHRHPAERRGDADR